MLKVEDYLKSIYEVIIPEGVGLFGDMAVDELPRSCKPSTTVLVSKPNKCISLPSWTQVDISLLVCFVLCYLCCVLSLEVN